MKKCQQADKWNLFSFCQICAVSYFLYVKMFSISEKIPSNVYSVANVETDNFGHLIFKIF